MPGLSQGTPSLPHSFLQGTPPRSAGSTLQLRPHPTSWMSLTKGAGSVLPSVTKWAAEAVSEERWQGQVGRRSWASSGAPEYPEGPTTVWEHVDGPAGRPPATID